MLKYILPELHAQSTQSESCIFAGSLTAMTLAGKTVNCVLLIVVQSLFITETQSNLTIDYNWNYVTTKTGI